MSKYQLSRVCFVESSRAALLHHPFVNTLTSCNSAPIALAQHLTEDLKLSPPGRHESNNHTGKDYFEPWSDLLSDLYFVDRIVVHKDELIFMAFVPEGYLDSQLDLSAFKIVPSTHNLLQLGQQDLLFDLFGLEVSKKQVKLRFAFVNFSMGITYQDKLQPKLQLAGLFTGIYYKPGDQWRHYRIHLGQIPTVEELSTFDVLVMSGSYCCINDQMPRVNQFGEVLKEVMEKNEKIRIHAACFGHQLICKVLGVEIFRHARVLGPEKVQFTLPEQLKLPSLQSIFKQGTFNIYEQHVDSAREVPPGFYGVGSSPSCEVEAIASENQRIFATQFHPEYADPYMKNVRNRIALYDGKEPLPEDAVTEDKEHLEHHETFRAAVRAFMEGE